MAVAPPHAAGVVDVTVTNATGIGSLAPPTIVFVVGSGFVGASKLTLAGVPMTFAVLSDTIIRVTLPARSAGAYQLVITGPGGVNVVDQASTFSVS